MKKFLIGILVIAIAALATVGYIKHNDEKKKEHLEVAYDSLWRTIPNDELHRYEYTKYEDVHERELLIEICAYNKTTNSNLDLEAFKDFLSQEYNEDGTPRVENLEGEIAKYVEWYYKVGGKQQYDKFFGKFADTYADLIRESGGIDVGYSDFNLEQMQELAKRILDPNYKFDFSLFKDGN